VQGCRPALVWPLTTNSIATPMAPHHHLQVQGCRPARVWPLTTNSVATPMAPHHHLQVQGCRPTLVARVSTVDAWSAHWGRDGVPPHRLSRSRRASSVRCARFDRNLHSRMALSFTPLLRLKLLHACDQWHSSRLFTPLTG
jgi:hypothetical protein